MVVLYDVWQDVDDTRPRSQKSAHSMDSRGWWAHKEDHQVHQQEVDPETLALPSVGFCQWECGALSPSLEGLHRWI